ncbi:HB22 protein, partial [Gymnorhina tibicen]|nr:HB22 protein [Gymnorhina tibicen]
SLGAPVAAGVEFSGAFQAMIKHECNFINGTDRVNYFEGLIYNREQLVHLDSDVGHYVGDTRYGEMNARRLNSDLECLEYERAQVDTQCRHNYEVSTPFFVE